MTPADLFDGLPALADTPPPRSRHGSLDPSREAAQTVAPRAPRQFALVLRVLEQGPANPEEITRRIEALGYPVLLTSIRPRASQLAREMGLIVATEQRARSEGGCKSTVYRLADATEISGFLARKAAEAEHGEGADNG